MKIVNSLTDLVFEIVKEPGKVFTLSETFPQ